MDKKQMNVSHLTNAILEVEFRFSFRITEYLFRHLKPLGFSRELIHAKLNTNFTKLMAQFVKQGYLVKHQVSGAGSDGQRTFEYTWGGRAEVEFGEKGVQKFVAMFYQEDVSKAVRQAGDGEEEEPVKGEDDSEDESDDSE